MPAVNCPSEAIFSANMTAELGSEPWRSGHGFVGREMQCVGSAREAARTRPRALLLLLTGTDLDGLHRCLRLGASLVDHAVRSDRRVFSGDRLLVEYGAFL